MDGGAGQHGQQRVSIGGSGSCREAVAAAGTVSSGGPDGASGGRLSHRGRTLRLLNLRRAARSSGAGLVGGRTKSGRAFYDRGTTHRSMQGPGGPG